jgi:hypothetical protein
MESGVATVFAGSKRAPAKRLEAPFGLVRRPDSFQQRLQLSQLYASAAIELVGELGAVQGLVIPAKPQVVGTRPSQLAPSVRIFASTSGDKRTSASRRRFTA